jgi:hypothetical protein
MKPRAIALATAAAVSLLVPLAFATGCAAEEAEEPIAYPEPIGYTPPGAASPPQSPSPGARAQAAPAPPPAQVSGDVVIGGEDDQNEYSDTDPSALSDFRSTLQPYGSWVDDATYGTVWVPSPTVVGQDFTPYVSAGHWTYDDDYVWVSDYDWGWAPFHYGRWVYAVGPGWEWIPGRAYAGAWVSWRYGWDDWAYVGWAPLPPTWCWRGGYAVGIGFVPVAPYAFVGSGELFAPRVGGRVLGGAQVGVIAAHTRPFVPASPGVGGAVVARPVVGGPSPSALHIAPTAVARVSMQDRGLIQARAYARPSSAVALGAHPSQSTAMRAPSVAQSSAFGRGAAPAYSSPAASHFGGRLGGGFAGNAASAPPMRAPSYQASARPSPYYGSPRFSGSTPAPSYRSYSSPASSPGYSSSFHGGGSFGSSGAFHGSSGGSGGGFHGGGGGGGGFHGGGGGGGGFHGGGGGGHGGGHR